MNVQYHHGTKDKAHLQEFTVAVIVPEKDPFLDFLAMTLDDPTIEIELDIGITKVSPKDKYVKKIGRKEALANLKPQTFKVLAIGYQGNRYKVQLENNSISMIFQISNQGEKIHLIEVS